VRPGIAGLGTYLPEQIRTNDAWPPSFGAREHRHGDRTFNDIPKAQDEVAAALVERDLLLEANDPFLGARTRHVSDESMTSVEAETIAARRALADAGIEGADVDLLISNAVVPDRVSLSSAVTVSHLIGAKRANAFSVEAACASALCGLEVARAYIEAGLARVVLLTQSHLLLRTFPLLHPAAPGLGDAASAMVVTAGGPLVLRSTYGIAQGEYSQAVVWVRGTDDATDTPWWKGGAPMKLGSRAPEQAKILMRDTVTYGASTVREACARGGVDAQRLRVLASVQPRGFLPGAMAEHLGLPRSAAVTTYEDIAHVGVCGPTFNLAKARELGLLEPGALVALYAQGNGFSRAAALIEVGAGAPSFN
jgi:3-oxoacyl-[acyl-carrier-protein] synthase-3